DPIAGPGMTATLARTIANSDDNDGVVAPAPSSSGRRAAARWAACAYRHTKTHRPRKRAMATKSMMAQVIIAMGNPASPPAPLLGIRFCGKPDPNVVVA